MKVIVYSDKYGTCCVVHPAYNAMNEGETEDDFISRIIQKDVPHGSTGVFVCDESSLPERTFRDAWKVGNGAVEHDMAKAREIHKERLRAIRAPKLAALDVEYMQADESGDSVKKTQIAAKKKALRDVTKDPAIASASTPDELKSVLPSALQ